MAFFKTFKRELGPVERFELALKDRQTERQRFADRLGEAERQLGEKRAAAERLAVSGAAADKLDRAETALRVLEDDARNLRTALVEVDEQIASTERALTDARLQRERDRLADEIEAMALAIEQAAPGFESGAAALVDAVVKSPVAVPEATRFSGNVDALRREVRAAVDLICWDLRSAAVRTRAGNANVTLEAPGVAMDPATPAGDRQVIFTLNPLKWREGDRLRTVAAFAVIDLPKALLPIALQHQHVDYLNARRVQTLMHVHGSEPSAEPADDDPGLVDLDALARDANELPKAEVA